MGTKNSNKLYFDFATVFSNTKHFIDTHNMQQTQLTQKLNSNHRATAELIIRLYLKQLNKAAQHDDLDPNELPGFNTYNESLAKCKGCTMRTIINHRERLTDAGFIIKKLHRGKGGVEIWINPKVLGAANLSTFMGNNVVKIGNVPSLFLEKAKNFHPLVHEQQEQLNNNSGVDNKGVPSGHQNGLDESETTRTEQEQDKNKEEKANHDKQRREKNHEDHSKREKHEKESKRSSLNSVTNL